MSEPGPAVLVMARAPAAAGTGAPLDLWLGADRAARLQAVLLRRAAAWAARTAPGAAFVAFAPADAREDFTRTVPEGVRLIAQPTGPREERVAGAAGEVLEATGRPVLIVGTTLPALGDYHAVAAASDLAAGCDVVLGVAIGGGLYLLGIRAPQPELFAVIGAEHDGETTRRHARRVTDDLRLEVGMLHYERALVTPQDARAMLADPLLPGDIDAALRA
jgi:glycosyltransferase A (GT-A) superfamily protein (DUF2064 family)